MKSNLTIERWPNKAGLMRGPNMMVKTCAKCLEDKTHGFWIYDEFLMKQSIFVCDDCLNHAKKEQKGK